MVFPSKNVNDRKIIEKDELLLPSLNVKASSNTSIFKKSQKILNAKFVVLHKKTASID
jgi:hypothetical protein